MLNIDALDLDSCRIMVWDSGGEGAPVVFTHGAGADHVMFDAQVRAVSAAGFRAVTWDMRGHGESRPGGTPFTAEQARSDLAAVLDHRGLENPVLIGQSLGGNLSQAMVRRFPNRFRALIVLDSTWNTAPLSWWERTLLRTAAPSLAMIPASRLPGVMANASAVTPEARADATRAFSLLSKQEFVEVWKATVDFLTPDPSYRTPIPLCLIRGEQDHTGNIRKAMPRWAAAEGIAEIVIPDAGHIVNQDAPEAVNRAIVDFLESLSHE